MCTACELRPSLVRSVERGMALLDARCVPEWDKKVDLGTLNISGVYTCVLGQVFDHYVQGQETLGVWGEESAYYGFNGNSHECAILTQIWREKIQQRRLDRISPRVSEPEIEREPALV